MSQVFKANIYRPYANYDRKYELIRQFNFPNTYDENLDKLTGCDHDRIFEWDYNHARNTFTKYFNTGELHLPQWVRNNKDKKIIEFAVELMKANTSIKWNGYRFMETTHMGNGYPVFQIELFYKHPDSKTKVYTGNNAPNINLPKGAVKIGKGRYYVMSSTGYGFMKEFVQEEEND